MAYAAVSLEDLRKALSAKRDGILQWTPEEERLAINEALRLWNLLTGRWRRRAAQNTGIGTVEYVLPSTMVYGMRVVVNNTPLTIGSLTELDLMRPTWRTETVASGGDVPTSAIIWAPISIQRIAIWPALNSVIVNGLSVDGVSATPVLTEAGDFVDLGQELLDHLLNTVLHLLAFKIGGPTWRATLPSFHKFLQAAGEENGVLKANQRFRRWAGLNRRIDLSKAKGESTQLDPLLGGGGLFNG
jgi:hypothetical protein